MEEKLGRKFIKASLIFFAVSVTVGVIFSLSPIGDIIMMNRYITDFHSHMSLIGWVSMAILGLIYCCLEDKNIHYDESLGNKGFLFLIAGSIMMPMMFLLTGLIHMKSGMTGHENTPVAGLTTISGVVLVIGSYMSIYSIYKAFDRR